MDYFVQDGELVSTKKGMQVSKTRHRGTRFVNAVMPTPAPVAGKTKTKTASSAASSDPFSSQISSFITAPEQPLPASTAASVGRGSFSVFSISNTPAPSHSPNPYVSSTASSSVDASLQLPIPSPQQNQKLEVVPQTVKPSSRENITDEKSRCLETATKPSQAKAEIVAKRTKATKKKSDSTTTRVARKKTTASSNMQIQQYQGLSTFAVNPALHKKQRTLAQTGRSKNYTVDKDQKVLACLLEARKLDVIHGLIPPPSSMNPFSYHSVDVESLPMISSSNDNTKFLHQLFEASMPETIYPMEAILTHNPIRSWEFFESVLHDMAKLHIVIVSSVFMELHCRGLRSPRFLASISFYLSRMCALVGDGLKEGDKASTKAKPYVLECIASMALIALFLDRHDDWHIHMKGLKRLVTSYGGIDGKHMDWYLIHKLRRCDSIGAVMTGCLPYLDYPRVYPDISLILPLNTRDDFCLSTHECMSAAGILPCVDTSVQALVVFHKAVMLTRKAPPRSILFDPFAFVDEWFHVIHKLTRYPMSLRDHCSLSQTRATGVTTPEEEPPLMRSSPSEPTIYDLLSPVARLASILFVYEFIQQRPPAPTGYIVTLSLLRDQIQVIVNHIKTHALGRSHSASPPGYPSTPALAPLYMIRPVLTWACIIGYIYAFRFPATECDPSFKPTPKRAIFCECIYLLFSDPNDRPTDTDSHMSELLDWTTISHSRLPTTLDAFVALMRSEYEAWLAEYVDGESRYIAFA